MGIIEKFVVLLVGNGVGLYASNLYIPGFRIDLDLEGFITATLALTVINFFIKPLIQLIFTPLIILTLGLASIALNIFTLYLLDYLLPTVTISGLWPLIYATILISFINIVIGFLVKIF